jgi:two-component system alkaline phosphatase synthesis response regulator PhoP
MAARDRNVLLVDDDRDFVLSTKAFLEGRGYTVDTAFNGTEGWEKIQGGNADVIVLDIMMDYDAEGFNLAYKIRQDERMRNKPIVIVSGFGRHLAAKMGQFQFVLGQDWPADAFFEKPVDLKELAKGIDRIIPAVS